MTDKHSEHRRKSKQRRPVAATAVDGPTVAWMTTLVSALACEIAAVAVRVYVRYGDPDARLLRMFSNYLLLAAAVIGAVLVLMTPIIVRRGRSNPPAAVVVAAYLIGAAPWFAMVLRAWE